MIYLLQVIIYTGLLLLVYLLLLRDKPMHKFNRVYLLATAVLPTLLPFIYLPQSLRPQTKSLPISHMLPEVLVTDGVVSPSSSSTSVSLFSIIYLAVVVVLLCTMVYKYLMLRRVIRKADKEHHCDYILLKNTGYGPGSWRKYIFLQDTDTNDTIIQHELAHIQQRHSLDILYIDIVKALLWPNVLLHFIKRELVLVHEYQADTAVGVKCEEYSQLLVSSLFKTCTLPYTHSFIFHPIKRRIMMLNTKKTPQKTRTLIAITTILTLCIGVVTLQSCEQSKEAQEVELVSYQQMDQLSKKPEYKGNLVDFFIENVVYPEEALQNDIEGKVVIKFVIDESGNATEIEVATKDPNPLFAKAALDAMDMMPAWSPGEINGKAVRTEFYLPFRFKLPEQEENVKEELKGENSQYDAKRKITNVSNIDRIKAIEARKKLNEYNSAIAEVKKDIARIEKYPQTVTNEHGSRSVIPKSEGEELIRKIEVAGEASEKNN